MCSCSSCPICFCLSALLLACVRLLLCMFGMPVPFVLFVLPYLLNAFLVCTAVSMFACSSCCLLVFVCCFVCLDCQFLLSCSSCPICWMLFVVVLPFLFSLVSLAVCFRSSAVLHVWIASTFRLVHLAFSVALSSCYLLAFWLALLDCCSCSHAPLVAFLFYTLFFIMVIDGGWWVLGLYCYSSALYVFVFVCVPVCIVLWLVNVILVSFYMLYVCLLFNFSISTW